MNFRDTSRIRQLFEKMNKMLLHEGDMFGVVSTGTSSIAIDLTYDKKRMDEAIKKIAGSALKPSELIEGPQGPNGNSELKYRAHVAFSTAYDIVGNLSKVQNRRKAVIYVSNGYDFNPFEGSRFGDPNIVGMKNDAVRPATPAWSTTRSPGRATSLPTPTWHRELSELTRAANRANATFYTIDPRGLVAGSDLDEQVDTTEWNNHIRKTQDSLRVIAEETGGFAVINQNDFDKSLQADRRREQRLLRPGVLLEQPRSAEAHAQDRSQGEAAEPGHLVAQVVLDQAAARAQGVEVARALTRLRGRRSPGGVSGPRWRLLRALARVRPVQRGPGAFDRFVQIALVELNPDEVDTQCRAGDGGAAESEERIGDGPDRVRGRAAEGNTRAAAAETSPDAAGPCRGSGSCRTA